jgi:predicted flap endonuclease-1-like 5' DNA nuclease
VNVEEIEGIGPVLAEKLRDGGVQTADDLLARGGPRSTRELLAQTTGIDASRILEWVNHVDLMRLPGVGEEYSDLLEAAGVDSLAELAQRNPDNLAQTFQELDAARPDWIRRLPSAETVRGWVESAASYERVVEH